jgi:hypothetical protein
MVRLLRTMSTDNSRVLNAWESESVKVHTFYIMRYQHGIVVTVVPTSGYLECRTTLSRSDLQDPNLFKNPEAVWRFAKAVGRIYVEGSDDA